MIPDPSKLLVIDNDAGRDDALSHRLTGQGYAVAVASNNLQALEKIRADRFDVVVVDRIAASTRNDAQGGIAERAEARVQEVPGLDLLHLLRATRSPSKVPVIVVRAEDSDPATVRKLIERALHDADQRISLLDPLAERGNRGATLARKNRMSMGLELQDAVEQNRLTVLYQPKINLVDQRIDGFEALLRWRRAGGQAVPPAEFIPIAEETGSIQKIGLWVLREACHQLARWQKQFPSHPPLTMNVNVSVKQLADRRLVAKVQQILDETGIAPETLKLELTESTLMSEVGSARKVLGNLRSLRVGLKLDDFGTGYSSLSYLCSLQFDSLKIPRSFVSKLGVDRKTRAIVETIVNLAHSLDMNVVAEGIETEQQLRELEKMGCDLGQGFLFHRPLDRLSIEKLLRTRDGKRGIGPRAFVPPSVASPAAAS